MNAAPANLADVVDRLEISNSAFGAGVAFHQDLAPDGAFVGRVGLAYVKTKLDATSGVLSASDSDSNAALYGGLGVGYKLSKRTTLDLAWDFSKSKYDKNGVNESGSIKAAFSLSPGNRARAGLS